MSTNTLWLIHNWPMTEINAFCSSFKTTCFSVQLLPRIIVLLFVAYLTYRDNERAISKVDVLENYRESLSGCHSCSAFKYLCRATNWRAPAAQCCHVDEAKPTKYNNRPPFVCSPCPHWQPLHYVCWLQLSETLDPDYIPARQDIRPSAVLQSAVNKVIGVHHQRLGQQLVNSDGDCGWKGETNKEEGEDEGALQMGPPVSQKCDDCDRVSVQRNKDVMMSLWANNTLSRRALQYSLCLL